MNLNQLIQANTYTESMEQCQGCENHCQVKLFHFSNGKVYASGNNCEKVYANERDTQHKGVNMFAEKYRLLFHQSKPAPRQKGVPALKIGIPRGLGIYENFPFWDTLFADCGFEVVLSHQSTNKQFEKGVRSIMADNICYPAKLMHGHVMELIERKVDRLFYPRVVFEQKEDEKSRNSFNCPIVTGYADVLLSSIDPEKYYGVPLDAPVVAFNDEKLLRASCVEYLKSLGVSKSRALSAITHASQVQHNYLEHLVHRAEEVLAKARDEHRMVILLAGRPYHTDPLIEHKISQAISDMGVDVITEHVALKAGQGVYDELNAVTQWAYPNRIFKAAYFVGESSYDNLHLVELTSFGCGPDAFILDEVNAILARYKKNLTILKIDDVNNIGSLRLRVRSLIESVNMSKQKGKEHTKLPFVTTRPFMEEDKPKTILAPYFAEGYSEFVPSFFKLLGYKLVNLPTGNQEAAEEGLKYANNDICYPATIVVGSIMRALNSGEYDLDNTAVIITQTGGQCRATNYYSLIKNAMVNAGYAHVPLLSFATSPLVQATQPGFHIDYLHVAHILVHVMAYADMLAKLYYSSAPRELEKGAAERVRKKYIEATFPLIEANNYKAVPKLAEEAVQAFKQIIDPHMQVPVMGVVGEIYVKYNSFSHKHVTRWLVEQGIEVVPPSIVGFFSTSFESNHANRDLHIKEESKPRWVMDVLYAYLRRIIKKYDRIAASFPFYRPSHSIFDIAEKSRQVISTSIDFGEGWFLPGEICDLAEHGVNNVISLQPFGCIANHIISKGIEKKIKSLYPKLNLLFLDFDSSTSEANVYNRLHFMVENARKM